MYHAVVTVQNQCKHLKSVPVSANFYGEYQSNQEAKQNVFGIQMYNRPLMHPTVSNKEGPNE